MTLSVTARTGCLTVAVLALAVLAPSIASASVVELRFEQTVDEGGRSGRHDVYALVVRGDPGEANRVSTSADFGREVFVQDAGATLRAAKNCKVVGERVSCTPPPDALDPFIGTVRIELGDGDDTLDAGRATLISGGPGDDHLISLTGGPVFDGGPGADRMESQGTLSSGLTYEGRTAPVSVTFDDVANDGETGERDDVRGLFGRATGGEGADRLAAAPGTYGLLLDGRGGNDELVGGGRDDRLWGGPGDDVIAGGAGDDSLDGGVGGDLLSGGPGADWLFYAARSAPIAVTLDDRLDDGEAGEGDNVLSDIENVYGGSAGDVIVGGAGPNRFDGGQGDDVLIGREDADILSGGSGADAIDGGPGTDSLFTDLADRVEARDGERDEVVCISRPPARLRADLIDVLRDCDPAIDLQGGARLLVTKRWTVSVGLVCRGPSTSPPCQGTVSIRPPSGQQIWAKRSVRLRVGEQRRVSFSLRPAGRRALAGSRTVPSRLVVVDRPFANGPRGLPRVRRILLRLPARR